MPRQRLPIQYFADILDQLKGVNERLDTLIGQSAPQDTPVPAEPSAEPERIYLEDVAGNVAVDTRQASEPVAQIDTDFPDSGRAENAPEGTCQEQTKRGNTCGKPLPCRYHG